MVAIRLWKKRGRDGRGGEGEGGEIVCFFPHAFLFSHQTEAQGNRRAKSLSLHKPWSSIQQTSHKSSVASRRISGQKKGAYLLIDTTKRHIA